jgi:hypothetical protein
MSDSEMGYETRVERCRPASARISSEMCDGSVLASSVTVASLVVDGGLR